MNWGDLILQILWIKVISKDNILVNVNQTITLVIDAETDTIVPIKAQSTFSIFVNNSAPIFKSFHEYIKVRISEGLNFSISYSNLCLSDSSMVTVSDDDKDSIYLTVNFDYSGYVQNQVVLNDQEWNLSLFINTSSFTPGNYSMKLSIWDIFHKDTPSNIAINLDVSYFNPPIFDENLPSSLIIQIWNLTKYTLPSISDADGNFSKMIINNQR